MFVDVKFQSLFYLKVCLFSNHKAQGMGESIGIPSLFLPLPLEVAPLSFGVFRNLVYIGCRLLSTYNNLKISWRAWKKSYILSISTRRLSSACPEIRIYQSANGWIFNQICPMKMLFDVFFRPEYCLMTPSIIPD